MPHGQALGRTARMAGLAVFVLACLRPILGLCFPAVGDGAIRASSAFALASAGLALALLSASHPGRLRVRIAFALASACLLGGVAALAVQLGGLSYDGAAALPGTGTAVGLVTAALALFLLRAPSRAGIASSQILAAAVAYIGLFAALAHFNALAEGAPATSYTSIGAAVLLLLLGGGALSARTDSYFIKLLASPTLGGAICRRTLPAAIVLPFFFGWLRRLGQSQGYYDAGVGLIGVSIINVTFFSCLVVWCAARVDNITREREAVDAERARLLERDVEVSRALAMSTAQFRHLVQSIDEYAIVALDTDGLITSWNAGAEAIFGYKDEEIVGQHFSAFYPLDAVATGRPAGILEQCRKLGRYTDAGRHVRKSGDEFWATVVINSTFNDAGALIGFAKITRDVTAWKAAEDRLRDNEERWRSVVDTVIDSVLIIDDRGLVQSANKATETMFGFAPDDLVGQNITVLMPEPYGAERDGYLETFLRTGERRVIGPGREVSGKRRDGSVFPVDLSIAEFSLKGKKFFTGIVRDITERKFNERRTLEEARNQQEALERRVIERTRELSASNSTLRTTVAELKESREELRRLSRRLYAAQETERSRIAREVHDEFGQMLAVMKLELIRLRKHGNKAPDVLETQVTALMGSVDETIRMLRRISSDLRPIVLEQLGLGAALEWLTADLAKRTGIACALKMTPDLGEIEAAVATSLFRIVQEALTNALKHAVTDRIDVEVERAPKALSLKIRDFGSGIRPQDVLRVSSLGLVGMRERSLDLGGTFNISEAEEGGTLVRVDVPMPFKGDRAS